MPPIVLLSRAFAVLAATMAVLAFTLFMLAPDNMSLIGGLAQISPAAPGHLRHAARHVLGNVLWTRAIVPLLVRPVWLVPACLALVCGGVAATTATPPQSSRSPRTRS